MKRQLEWQGIILSKWSFSWFAQNGREMSIFGPPKHRETHQRKRCATATWHTSQCYI